MPCGYPYCGGVDCECLRPRCRFAVGDRVRDTLAPSHPDATVTAVREDGSFDWRFDQVHVAHARLGISYQEGTTTPYGAQYWTRI